MVRTSLKLTVYGITESEIRRRAVSQVNEFLGLPIDDTSANYDMEIEVSEVLESDYPTYVGNVLVKIKH